MKITAFPNLMEKIVMHCRVCGSADTNFIIHYQPYVDYGVDIYDCTKCLSRFTPHDETMHEKLHSRPSSYSSHIQQEKRIIEQLNEGDLEGAKAFLCKRESVAYVISTIDGLHNVHNIMEIGCSRGYVSAYFLTLGKRILGVDVSSTAIEAAKKSFGDHFCVLGSDRIRNDAPYDAIFHVGTIGCVSSPIEVTRFLLDLLKPGGVLIFNAPNRMSCDILQNIWISTPPPDLVTLFHPDFWKMQFTDLADAEVEVLTAGRNLSGLSRSLGKIAHKPVKYLFQEQTVAEHSLAGKVFRRMKHIALSFKGPLLPHDYGIHVVLKKKS